jgi:hypothetical protein
MVTTRSSSEKSPELLPYDLPVQLCSSRPELQRRLASPSAAANMSHLYRPGAVLPDLRPFLHQIVEIKIPVKYLSTRNKEVHCLPRLIAYEMTFGHWQIRTRQIWGTDVYTDDSDVVAGLFRLLLVRALSLSLSSVDAHWPLFPPSFAAFQDCWNIGLHPHPSRPQELPSLHQVRSVSTSLFHQQ